MAQFPRGAVMTATSEAFCADETIYPGKSAPVGGADFTKEMREVPVKPKLKRVPFTVSRLMEFCTKRELVNQTGHDFTEWPLVVLKELIDNSGRCLRGSWHRAHHHGAGRWRQDCHHR
jgi:hypothetical protein